MSRSDVRGSRSRSALWRVAAAVVSTTVVTASCGGPEPSAHPLEPAGQPSSSHAGPGSGSASTSGSGSGRTALIIEDPRVAESSGLARSHLHPGVLYTHNDRGGSAEVFAVDASGTRAVLRLDAAAQDWEDIASTPDGELWVADIGDNDEVRPSVTVEVVSEPGVLASASLETTTYTFRYPDGPHNAEALLVDPRTDRLHIVTKEPEGGTVYAAPRELSTERTNLLHAVAEAPPGISGGAVSDDGSVWVLRNQRNAYFYRNLTDAPTTEALPRQPQGESIVFEEDGAHVLVGSEGAESSVLRVPVPTSVLPADH